MASKLTDSGCTSVNCPRVDIELCLTEEGYEVELKNDHFEIVQTI